MMNPQEKALTLTMTVNGRRTEDLIEALQVIMREVEEGHIEGFNCNYTGDYHYRVKENSEVNPEQDKLAA
jgi:hypothetical protein